MTKVLSGLCGWVLTCLALSSAHAEGLPKLQYRAGGLDVRAHAGVIFQGAAFDKPQVPGGMDTHGRVEAYGLVNAEWVTSSGVVLGAHAEGYTNDTQADALNNDRIYGYVSTEWGRLEVGRQIGAGRRLALYAPLVGTGQIRGEFSRFAGSSALLWPYDTRQSFKLVYLTPPLGPLRLGVSWSPETVRFATRQKDGVELSAQLQQLVAGWVMGLSGAWSHANPGTPGLIGISSWSVGVQARRGSFVIGGAYVDRGDSNRTLPGFNQSEINMGVAWRAEKWDIGLAGVRSNSSTFDNRVLSLGGAWRITPWLTWRADANYLHERIRANPWRDGVVFVSEIEFHI